MEAAHFILQILKNCQNGRDGHAGKQMGHQRHTGGYPGVLAQAVGNDDGIQA